MIMDLEGEAIIDYLAATEMADLKDSSIMRGH